jgi:hypothetical protein
MPKPGASNAKAAVRDGRFCTQYVDGRKVTIGFAAEGPRWLPALSIDPPNPRKPRIVITAHAAHSQASPKAAMLVAWAMAQEWRALVAGDPAAKAKWPCAVETK